MDNKLFEQKLKSMILKNITFDCTENDITDDSDLIEDFKFNSIHIIQLIMDVESDFGIQIEDDFFVVESISKYTILKNHIIDMVSRKGEK